MKLIYEPTVYVLSIQQILTPSTDTLPGLDKFFHDHGTKYQLPLGATAADTLPEVGGRICYMSFDSPRPGGNEAYLNHIKEVGHGSVLEHTVIGMIFTGISRSLSHELVRHRAGWAYSQLSQRYVDESVAEYVVPLGVRKEVEAAELFLKYQGPTDYAHDVASKVGKADPGFWKEHSESQWLADAETGMFWMNAVRNAHDAYVKLADQQMHKLKDVVGKTEQRKTARQTARSLLPNCTETKVVGTANARALRHFIEMRCHPAADAEIRVLAGKVWEACKTVAPNLFSDYTKTELPDGTFALNTPYQKV